jgi:uncharacterized protein (DUF2235 family)
VAKNIVVLLDGTNQEGGKSEYLNTNVYKMYTLLEERSPRQVVFYERGVGAGWRKITGNVGGAGISNRILRAYRFIHDHYEHQDRIFLFGFSRGATEVRSLANFIEIFQFLPRSRPDLIKSAWEIYRTRLPPRWWARRRIVRYRRYGVGRHWWEVLIQWLARRGTDEWDLRDPFDVLTSLLPEGTRFQYRRLYGRTLEERISELKEEMKDLTSEQVAALFVDPYQEISPTRFLPGYEYGRDPAADAIRSDVDDALWHLRNLSGVFDDKSDPAAWLRTFKREECAARILSASGSRRTGARVPVHFLGCFDTVAALGLPFPRLRALTDRIPGMYHSFHDLRLSRFVTHACHALALDEERRAFLPELWKSAPFQRSHQVWFSGVHTDVGGGYLENGLSEVTLSWMLRMGHAAGLLLARKGTHHFPIVEDPKGVLHDSRDTLLKKWLFGEQKRRPFEMGEVVLHRSVLERMNSDAPTWEWQDGRPVEVSAHRYRNRLRSVLGSKLDSGMYHVDEQEPEPFDLTELVKEQEEMWSAWAKAGYPLDSLDAAWDLARNGERDKLVELLADLPKIGLEEEIARIYACAGDLDRAFAYLNEAFAHHPTSLRGLSTSPGFTGIRDDARFDELLKKLGNLGCGDAD